MPVIRACAIVDADERGAHRPGEIGFAQVVDVDAARGKKPRILRTDHPRAQNAHLASADTASTAFPANLHLAGSAILARATQSQAPPICGKPQGRKPAQAGHPGSHIVTSRGPSSPIVTSYKSQNQYSERVRLTISGNGNTARRGSGGPPARPALLAVIRSSGRRHRRGGRSRSVAAGAQSVRHGRFLLLSGCAAAAGSPFRTGRFLLLSVRAAAAGSPFRARALLAVIFACDSEAGRAAGVRTMEYAGRFPGRLR